MQPLLLVILLAIPTPAVYTTSLSFSQASGVRSPVILIPGDGGAQLEAKLDGKPSVPHWWCRRRTKRYFPIWLNLRLLTQLGTPCLVDNMRLVFNPATNMTHNSPKVRIRVPKFGDTSTIEYFDRSRIFVSAYFNDIAERLVAEGYVRNQSLRGAPFDFRRGVHDNPRVMTNLKFLIESTCASNGGRPALIIAHSFGNNIALAFLQSQSADWKQRYIRALLAVAPPIGGAVKALRALVSGDSLDIPLKSPLALRPVLRSFSSTAYLMPHRSLWPPGEVLVSRPGRNYSSAEYAEFFNDIGYPEGKLLREAATAEFRPDVAPGVEVHCIYGVGVKTPGRLVWHKSTDWPDVQPDVVWEDGDGTVNLRSLQACVELWGAPGAQQQPVYNFTIDKAGHLKILHRPEFLNYITDLISKTNAEASRPTLSNDNSNESELL